MLGESRNLASMFTAWGWVGGGGHADVIIHCTSIKWLDHVEPDLESRGMFEVVFLV